MRRLKLLLLCAALLPVARAAPEPPLCTVQATTRPLWWASNLRQFTVRLTRGCDGVAYVRLGQYGGPGSKATGPTETLNKDRPQIIWSGQPYYRTVLWVAKSGKTYAVPLVEVRAYAPEDR